MGGLWDYMKTLFGSKVDEMKDPEIEIEQAIRAAQERNKTLRNQAAKVVANRTHVANELEQASAELAEAEAMARQAVLKADEAAKAGDAEAAAKWTRTAQSLAMKMTASKNSVEMLTAQLQTAEEQAEQAKLAVQQNAMELEQISAKRIEMLGQLESAKMQEELNKTMAQLNSSLDDGGAPSMKQVEDKIQKRMAEAKAKAEIEEVTPEGSLAELKRSVDLAESEKVLDDLKAQLGIGATSEQSAIPSSTGAPT
jgi:phage shock protein A